MFGNIWGFELYGSYPKMEQISPHSRGGTNNDEMTERGMSF